MTGEALFIGERFNGVVGGCTEARIKRAKGRGDEGDAGGNRPPHRLDDQGKRGWDDRGDQPVGGRAVEAVGHQRRVATMSPAERAESASWWPWNTGLEPGEPKALSAQQPDVTILDVRPDPVDGAEGAPA